MVKVIINYRSEMVSIGLFRLFLFVIVLSMFVYNKMRLVNVFSNSPFHCKYFPYANHIFMILLLTQRILVFILIDIWSV